MLISRNWIKKYVNLADSVSIEELVSRLNLSTVEVERYEEQGRCLANIVVGKILKIDSHKDADKLKVCLVDVGRKKLTIVCGGSNLFEGMLVVVAEVGAKVKWHGEGEEVELKSAEIRGVKSEGMICGADEVGLEEFFPKKEMREIIDLSTLGVRVGTPLSQALGLNDYILEIDNKSLSHRPDLWGHYGLAREVAALYNRKVTPYKNTSLKPDKEANLEVQIDDPKLCRRYMGVMLSNVKVGDSPFWLKKSLIDVGIRPINIIVDITNYVMLDLGQPLHAFDADKVGLKDQLHKKLIVRTAHKREELTTLDGKKYALDSDNIVIADEQKILALAGVIGGLDSGVTLESTQIILESACFNDMAIRKSAGFLNVRTDASIRFEKSLDPNLCEEALNKAVELILDLVPGSQVASSIVDFYPEPLKPNNLTIPLSFFSKKLGVDIPPKNILAILDRLGFEVRYKSDKLNIKIPTWRGTKDIFIPEDIVEEVARLYGYEHILSSLPLFPIVPPITDKIRVTKFNVLDILVKEFGYTEVYNYSFVSSGAISKLGDNQDQYIELNNPLSKDRPFLRRNLVINLLENLEKNYATNRVLKLVEIGKSYLFEEAGVRVTPQGNDLLPRQDTTCTFLYIEKNNNTPFWEVRRVVERIFHLEKNWLLKPPRESKPWQHSARAAEIVYKDKEIGSIYELHPFVLERWGIKDRAAIVEINLNLLADTEPDFFVQFNSTSLYPEATRDVAFWVSKKITHAEIWQTLTLADQLVRKVELFDVYSDNTKDEIKSMAYRITYGHSEKTLTTQEIDEVHQKIIKTLINTFKAEIRV